MHGTARSVDAFSPSQQNDFPLRSMLNALQLKPKVREREDTFARTRDACVPQIR
jgi:hypothetical protein